MQNFNLPEKWPIPMLIIIDNAVIIVVINPISCSITLWFSRYVFANILFNHELFTKLHNEKEMRELGNCP